MSSELKLETSKKLLMTMTTEATLFVDREKYRCPNDSHTSKHNTLQFKMFPELLVPEQTFIS